MKKTLKPFGIIASLAIIVVLMTSASVWDSKTPKADRVSLYYPDNFEIEAVNGETKSMGPILRVFPGKGALAKGKLSLVIAPGQTTLKIAYKSLGTSYTELSYNFEPGGHYRLIPSLREGFTMADFAKSTVGLAEDMWNWKVDKIK
jgi:hypothetical protein